MLAKLVKNTGTAEQRLKLIQELIDKEYYSLASQEVISLSQLNLSHKQKGELLYKQAKISLGLSKDEQAILYIEKLKNNHKDFAAPHKIKLIEAFINLQDNKRAKVEAALEALKALSSHEDKDISSHASLILINYKLDDKVSVKNTEVLNKWFLENKDSKFYLEVCRSLIELNKKLNTETPGSLLSKEEKRITELLEIYLDKNVLAQNRMAVTRDILKYFSARYKKVGSPKELIPIIEKLLNQLSDKEGTYETLGRFQLNLLSSFAEKDVQELRKIGLFKAGKAHENTVKFTKLLTSLLDKGLISGNEAIKLTEAHLSKVTDGHDFKLQDEIWAAIKAKVSAQYALTIDLKMIHRRADHLV